MYIYLSLALTCVDGRSLEKSRGGVPIAPEQLLLDMDSHWLTVVVKAQKDPHAMLFCTHIKHDDVRSRPITFVTLEVETWRLLFLSLF